MAYITNNNLTIAHINALITLCGFTDVSDKVDPNYVKGVQTDNGEIVSFTDLPGARDYLVHQLIIRRTMNQLANIT